MKNLQALQRAALAEHNRVRSLVQSRKGAHVGADFGTIGGHHSVAEVIDFVAAKDFENAKMQSAYDALAASIKTSNTAIDWKKDWDAYLTRYGHARAGAQSTINTAHAQSLISDANFPAEDTWVGLLQAEQQVGLGGKVLGSTPIGPYQKGDKQDLYNRLETMKGSSVDFTGMPQPRPGTDTDLQIYQSADTTLKKLDDQTNPKKNPLPYVLGGLALAGAGYLAYKVYVPKF